MRGKFSLGRQHREIHLTEKQTTYKYIICLDHSCCLINTQSVRDFIFEKYELISVTILEALLCCPRNRTRSQETMHRNRPFRSSLWRDTREKNPYIFPPGDCNPLQFCQNEPLCYRICCPQPASLGSNPLKVTQPKDRVIPITSASVASSKRLTSDLRCIDKLSVNILHNYQFA